MVELRAAVVALTDLREVVLDHLLGHEHTGVGHARPLLAGLTKQARNPNVEIRIWKLRGGRDRFRTAC